MSGIPSQTLKQLRQTLGQCEEYFASNSSLRDLFTDGRIHPFRPGLPERDSVNGRIEATIAHLANKQRVDGRNALVLFLHVLSDQLDEADQRHAALQKLASQLSPHSPLSSSPSPHDSRATPWNTQAIRDLLTTALDDQTLTVLAFDHFRPVYDQFSDGLTRTRKIQLLLDHCTRHDQMESLLSHIKRLNPAQYRRHQPHLTRDT